MKNICRLLALFFVLLLSACSMDATGLDGDALSRAAGDPVVQLVSARTKVVRDYPAKGFLSGDIELENIAYTKVVQIHYSINGGTWQDASAWYVSSLGNNRERWSFRIQLGEYYGMDDRRMLFQGPAWNVQFAVKYTVNGVTYWDNNGGSGNDYRVSSEGKEPLYAMAALGKNRITLISATYSDFPTTYFRGYIAAKELSVPGTPKVVFTTDNWQTTGVIDPSSMMDQGVKNGVHTWFFLGRDYGNVTVEFALAYEAGGTTSWDNNFTANYRVGWGVSAP